MKRLKNKSGITLIALVITIIVLMILSGVAVSLLRSDKSIMQGAQDAGSKYESGATEEKNAVLNANIKLEEQLLGDGLWNDKQKVNSPLLMEGMKAVYWSKDGGKTASTTEEGAEAIYSDNPNFNWDYWYNYVAGDNSTDTKQSRWANAVTEDGSYWVWIPRFKYKIDYTGVGNTPGNDVAGKIDVVFIKTSEQSGATGYTTIKEPFTANNKTTYEFITRDTNGYILHSAFENGSITSGKAKTTGWEDTYAFNNGEWDAELPGFWVAKYEMSMADASGTHIETTESNGNVPLSSNVKMLSVPTVSNWKWITIGQIYTNCLAYDDNVNNVYNSHLIKNSEWGAAAYLAHSQYGRNGHEVTINNNINWITGIAGSGPTDTTTTTSTANSYNTSAGMLASTTGNIYGIYDMNGNCWEYVATYNDKGSSFTYGTSFAGLSELSTKYVTIYSNETGTNNGEIVNTVCRIGDGIKEVCVSEYSGWFNDRSEFFTISNPFIARSGWKVGIQTNAGIFSSGQSNGVNTNHISFRAVLCNVVQ